MFTDIFSVNLKSPVKFGRRKLQHFAVKLNTLGSEVMFYDAKGKAHIYLMCEMPDAIREVASLIRTEKENA